MGMDVQVGPEIPHAVTVAAIPDSAHDLCFLWLIFYNDYPVVYPELQ